MKTLKLTLIAVVLLSAVTAFSNNVTRTAENKKHTKCVKMSLSEAIQDPVLVWTMYNQLNDSFLRTENLGSYTASVLYNKTVYLITGTYEEWALFFVMDYTGPKIDHQRTKARMQ
jgi:hypothetical protein